MKLRGLLAAALALVCAPALAQVTPGTSPLSILSGGTGGATAAAARSASGLNIDSLTSHGDSNYTILPADRTVGTNAALTAARTWTLPAANAVNPGQTVVVADFFGGVTSTNTLTVSRAGSDTIAGTTSVVMNTAYSRYEFRSDGSSKWSVTSIAASGSTSLIDLTKPPYNACTGSDDTAQILLWMAAAKSGGSTPGIAYAPPGTNCIFNGVLWTPSNITFWLYDVTFKMLAGGSASTTFCVCDSTGGSAAGPSNVRIRGLRLDGNTASRTGPFSYGNFAVFGANDVWFDDTKAVNCSSDCYNLEGNSSTIGLSQRIHMTHIQGIGAGGSSTRNVLSIVGVNVASIIDCNLQSGGSASPGAGIDIEPQNINQIVEYVTIDGCTINANSGYAIAVNPSNITGGVVQSQAMNITAFANNGGGTGKDFVQSNTAATKAGFRFINAHGVFDATGTPAVDALP